MYNSSNPADNLPKLVNVRIVTEPPGAQVTVWGIHPIYGIPDEKQYYPLKGRTPSELKLPPGEYLVVAALDDGRFHEVLRFVPPSPNLTAIGIRHRYFETEGETIIPRAIEIPEKEVVNDMALVPAADLLMGEVTSSIHHIPAFFIESHEATMAEVRRVRQDLPTSLKDRKDLPADNFPANGITWEDALWVAELHGKRLLFESEFELIATQGGKTSFPWGNDPSKLLPWPFLAVGQPQHDLTQWGAVAVNGLMSNVAEWTMNPGSFPVTEVAGTKLLPQPAEGTRIVRGGDDRIVEQLEPRSGATARNRIVLHQMDRKPGVGFRFARSQRPRLTPESIERIQSK